MSGNALFHNSEFQKRMRARVSSESSARNGAKGAAAQRKKYGAAQVAQWAAQHRTAHPTALQTTVAGWLEELGVKYEAEKLIVWEDHFCFADFYVPSKNLVLEADGAIWHRADPLHGQDRAAYTAARDAWLIEAGYSVVHLSEADIQSGAALEMLREIFK